MKNAFIGLMLLFLLADFYMRWREDDPETPAFFINLVLIVFGAVAIYQ